MRINNNTSALSALNSYRKNLNELNKSMLKLSSGYRINSAADDPAGLAISERMRSEIRGTNAAVANTQKAYDMIHTADGYLNSAHSILQKMNELAVQSANGTNDTLDRNTLQAEFAELYAELQDIFKSAEFNDFKLFDGSLAGTRGATAGLVDGIDGTILTDAGVTGDFSVSKTGSYSLSVSDTGVTIMKGGSSFGGEIAWADMFNETTGAAFDPNSFSAGDKISFTMSNGAEFSFTVGSTTDIDDVKDALSDLSFRVHNTSDGVYDGVGMVLQIGSREGDTMAISLDSLMDILSELEGLDISSATGAGQAIDKIRDAIGRVSDQRGYLAAIENRLEYKMSYLSNQALNLAEAESRIRDVDMAKETIKMTTASIKVQASMAMMSHMSSLQQSVLQLLHGGLY